jgi:hypothetical protein
MMSEAKRLKFFTNKSKISIAMLKLGELADVTLIFNGVHFKCHKFQLATSSEYFRMMFSSGFRESSAEEIEIKTVEAPTAKTVIKYLYGAPLKIDEENAPELLAAADLFLLHDAKLEIEEFLCDKVCVGNCFELINVAKVYHLEKLSLACTNFFHRHAKEMIEEGDFGSLDEEDMKKFLRYKGAVALNEDKYMAIQKWARHSRCRKTKFEELIFRISFSSMSKDFVLRVVMVDKLMRSYCAQLLQDVIQLHMTPEQMNHIGCCR